MFAGVTWSREWPSSSRLSQVRPVDFAIAPSFTHPKVGRGRRIPGVRDRERDGGISDHAFGPDQTLSQGGRRDEERRAGPGRIEAEHGLEHQRSVQRRIDGGMGAGEQELQSLVGDRAHLVGLGSLVAEQHQRRECSLRDVAPTSAADERPLGRGQHPTGRSVRDAPLRPRAQGGFERVGEHSRATAWLRSRGGRERSSPFQSARGLIRLLWPASRLPRWRGRRSR